MTARFTTLFGRVAIIALLFSNLSAAEFVPDQLRSYLSLNGEWECLLENGDAEAWKPEVAKSLKGWQKTDLPGNIITPAKKGDEAWKELTKILKKTKSVWIRKNIELNEKQAAQDVVLRWGGIKFGATAWLNGTKVTEYAPISPHTVILPKGILTKGGNTLLIKVPGWAGVPKNEAGFPLVPTGASTQSWGGKGPNVNLGIWLEFYQSAITKYVLTLPDLKNRTATFRIWLDGTEKLPVKVTAEVAVFEKGKKKAVATAVSALKGEKKPQDIVCKLPTVKTWSPESPNLYKAEIVLKNGDKECDRVRFTFGMREPGIKDGHFTLNGKPLWLRGSNILSEWTWGPRFKDKAKEYLVDEARTMNLNCFRTHTTMPPPDWLDTTDTYGTMILAESPLLYNHADFKFTDEDLKIWHKNAIDDIIGWMTRLWNHPSIVFWVIANESMLDSDWESTELYSHVKQLDPTRLVMRTGDMYVGTPDVLDIHTCFNMKKGGDGSFQDEVDLVLAGRDPAVPISNSEYMNLIGNPDRKVSGKKKGPAWPMVYAEFTAEHTEFMRRKRFDCLLPYMYARWSGVDGRRTWRKEYAHPVGAALHSSMAPVLASLDLFDRNFVTGSAIEADMDLINETYSDVKANVTIYVTPCNPLFLPDTDSLKKAISKQTLKYTLKAGSHTIQKVKITVPKAEGAYFVAAVLTRKGDTPVVSQREIRAVDAAKTTAALKGKKVMVLAGDPELHAWLKKTGAILTKRTKNGKVDADVVLVWDQELINNSDYSFGRVLINYLENGGRIVSGEQQGWMWNDLDSTVNIGMPPSKFMNHASGSRAHRADSTFVHPVLKDIPEQWLWRWNGLPGIIADKTILESSPSYGKMKKLLWVSRTNNITLASLPRGKGELLLSQLKFKGRLSGVNYDPVAERVLVNLLTK